MEHERLWIFLSLIHQGATKRLLLLQYTVLYVLGKYSKGQWPYIYRWIDFLEKKNEHLPSCVKLL